LAAQTGGPHHFTAQDFVGSLVWLVGFLFEAVGDLQLARFKSNPQNKGTPRFAVQV
jgi:steroid 5-alpha reductase family enzyme